MIDKIAELNIVLWSVNKLMDHKKCAVRDLVIEECKSNIIEGRMPEHELIITYCVELGFLKEKPKLIELCTDGETFINLNDKNSYDLSDHQKNFLVRTCFLNGTLRKQTRDCLKCFVESTVKGTFVWSLYDNTPLGNIYWIAEHLFQLGVLSRTGNGYEVNANYAETIAIFLSEPKGWTEEEFEQYMKEKKQVGQLAEELIMKYEQDRLKHTGFIVESHSIRGVGKLKVNAGYDIESFDGKSKGMNYDRFIEVKGSKGQEVRFFWSQNEMEVAKKLGNKYWIYYQGGIDVEKRNAKNKPILFQNPLVSLEMDNRIKKTAMGMFVESKIKGEIIKS